MIIYAGEIARDQVDFFVSGTSTRITNLIASNLSLKTFVNNSLAQFILMDGSGVSDANISPGIVYFNQISGAPGYYSVRFFPTTLGFWRICLSALNQEPTREYEVRPRDQINGSSGLIASFY